MYTAPSWIVNRQLVEGIQYDITYDVKNNPQYKNLTISRIVEHRNEIVVESSPKWWNAPQNAPQSESEALAKDTHRIVSKILEMLEMEKLEQ